MAQQAANVRTEKFIQKRQILDEVKDKTISTHTHTHVVTVLESGNESCAPVLLGCVRNSLVS